MALSLKTLRELFPKDEPAFKPPFYVETNGDGEIIIYDADDDALLTFCTHTQLPINDDRALAAEVSYWEIEAGRLVTALNAAYPSPASNVIGWLSISEDGYKFVLGRNKPGSPEGESWTALAASIEHGRSKDV